MDILGEPRDMQPYLACVEWLRRASSDSKEWQDFLAGKRLSEEAFLRFVSIEYGYPYINLDEVSVDSEFISRFPARILIALFQLLLFGGLVFFPCPLAYKSQCL